MASTKLTCPECESVLRLSKPVAPGKKVKCPKCETVFTAPREEIEDLEEIEEVEEARPRQSAGKKSTKSASSVKDAKKKEEKPAPAAKKPADDDEDGGTYGYIKEPEEEGKDVAKKKPKVRYGPDTTIRDPRGPATTKVTDPSNYLQLVGLIGTLGWLALTILIIFPAVFPIEDKSKKKDPNAIVRPQQGEEKDKKGPPQPPFFVVYGLDLRPIIDSPWYLFMAWMIPFIAAGLYSALIVSGGIKMQNLESRGWGYAAAVMAILPLNTAGLNVLIALLLHWLVFLVLEDAEFGMWVSIGLNVILWLASVSVGIWNIKTLGDEEVIEGFEFVPEN